MGYIVPSILVLLQRRHNPPYYTTTAQSGSRAPRSWALREACEDGASSNGTPWGTISAAGVDLELNDETRLPSPS